MGAKRRAVLAVACLGWYGLPAGGFRMGVGTSRGCGCSRVSWEQSGPGRSRRGVLYSIRTGQVAGSDDPKGGYSKERLRDPDAELSEEEWQKRYGEETDTSVLYDEKELERRRIDAIRVARYMDVMGVAKTGESHPRVALAAKAHSKKEVERLSHGMLYRKLGKSDLVISEVGLGTMTWGEQCTEEQAHAQLNLAVDEYGVNFVVAMKAFVTPRGGVASDGDPWCGQHVDEDGYKDEDEGDDGQVAAVSADADAVAAGGGNEARVMTQSVTCGVMDTAELYPVPADPDTSGLSEKILGKWLKKRRREDIVVGSKITGYSEVLTWLRKDKGPVRLTAKQITEAVEGSLKRLGTDYIDLIQLHWPDRYLNLFGVDLYDQRQERDDAVSFEEQIEALGKLVKQGKVRYVGLSNESPYGVMKFLEIARKLDLPEVVSLQSCYNLLYRNEMDMGLSEVCSPRHENLGVICYSPLAGGVLTGKYMFKGRAPDSRLNRFPGYMSRYRSVQCQDSVFEFKEIASRYGFTMTQIALGWVYSRPFVTSTLVGATSVDQLRENLDALNTPIFAAVVYDLTEVFVKHRDPSRTFVKILDDGDV